MSHKVPVAVFATLAFALSVQAQTGALTAHMEDNTADTAYCCSQVINLIEWPVAAGGNGHWYGVLPEVLYWEEADSVSRILEHEGRAGYLATVTSAAENDFILHNVIAGTSQSSILDEFWLGGRDRDGEWMWATGEPFSYVNWGPGEPNNTGIETALGMWGWRYGDPINDPMRPPGTWNNSLPNDSVNPLHKWWSVIEWGAPDSTVLPDSIIHLVQWPKSAGGNDHWYAICTREVGWNHARSLASTLVLEGVVGHLATITSGAENEFIMAHVIDTAANPTPLDKYWLGGQYAGGFAGWIWITAEPFFYTNWAEGEPDNEQVEIALSLWGPTSPTQGQAGTWSSEIASDFLLGASYRSIVEWPPPEPPVDTLLNLVQWPKSEGGNDHWYAVLPRVLLWKDAAAAAVNLQFGGRKGYLATIKDQAENDFIFSHVLMDTVQPGSCCDEFWLGGFVDTSGAWSWMTLERFSYTNWAPGEPNNPGIENALAMWGYRSAQASMWNNACIDDEHASHHRWWSVIEWGEPDHTDPPLARLIQWPKSQGGNDHWYGVLTEHMCWPDAEALAHSLKLPDGQKGYLATVTSQAENDFIVQFLVDTVPLPGWTYDYWLGGRYVSPLDQWTWISGEAFEYTNWGPGEPDDPMQQSFLALRGWPDPVVGEIGTWNSMGACPWVIPEAGVGAIVEFGEPAQDEVTPTNEWISLFCPNPWLDGRLLKPGSEIRAFDPDGILCGKGTVKADGSYGFLNVYRDDPYTRRDEGAGPGDVIMFTINGVAAAHDPDIVWNENGDVVDACNFVRQTCLEIPLYSGWNLISWNIEYTAPIEEAIAAIRNKIEVILSFDGEGQTFDPVLPEYSTLQTVDYFHGYWFKMEEPATLVICGQWAPHAKSINIYPGWNLVSYWPDIALPTEIGLASILDNVMVAMGYDGQALTWMPGMQNFNTLTELKPLFGYWIKSFGPGNLFWTYGGASADNDQHTAPAARANDGLTASRQWIAMYGRHITLDGVELAGGTVVEAVTDVGQVCGRGWYDGDVLPFTAVYGYDSQDAAARAYPGVDETVRIRVNGLDTDTEIAWSEKGARILLTALTSAGSTDALPERFELSQNYPNPFNPTTEIAFALPVASHVTVEIYNITGQKAALLVDEKLEAGRHVVRWDAGGMASGVYLYRLRAGSFTATKKMVLLK
ncbi:MAG: T9SS type A sorting domain-containing protein [candidate division Zixibacteria bacterium]|nr:T9SS type A sorting domain-containing protein [candidate division Zixibacteria bacterium]